MKSFFIEDDFLQSFEKALVQMSHPDKTILILSCDQNEYDYEQLNEILRECESPLFGALFPQVIYDGKSYEKGTILVQIDDFLDLHVIQSLSEQEDISTLIEEQMGEIDELVKTMFVFIDGMSQNINEMILGLFDNYGININYIGGGAGSLSFVHKPCIFTNLGILEDCAVVASSKLDSTIGVQHGYEEISDKMQVTSVHKNVVLELDYTPAFEVYKEIVEQDSDRYFDQEKFFDLAKSYPLGINRLSGEIVVRDPITQDENSLICVGEITENSFVSILKGDKEKLLGAAKRATSISQEHAFEKSFTLFIDCISRALFLEDEFQKELQVVYDQTENMIGALTLGEIGNNQDGFLEFYNKTAVVAQIEEIE